MHCREDDPKLLRSFLGPTAQASSLRCISVGGPAKIEGIERPHG